MKTTAAVLASSLLLLVVARASAQDPPAPAAPPAGEKIKLAFTPAAGDKFALENTMHMNVQVMGIDQEIDINQLIVMQIESVAADRSFAMRNRIARIWGKMSNPMMGDFDFDSDKPAEQADPDDRAGAMKVMLQKQFTAMAGKDITLQMSSDGTVKTASTGDATADQMAQQMSGLGKLPEKPVGVGDTWDAETTQAGMQGMKMKVKLKNTLKAFDADTVTIEQQGAMDIAGDKDGGDPSNPAAAMMANMKTKSSSMKNTLKLSRKDGLTLSGDMETNIEMSMGGGDDAAGGGMPAGGLEMAMKMKMHQERKAAPPDAPAKPEGGAPKDAPKNDGKAPPKSDDAPPPVVPPAPDGK